MPNPVVREDLEHIHQSIAKRSDRLREAVVVMTGCAGFLGYYLMQYLVRYAGPLGVSRVIGLDTFLLDRPRWLDELARGFPSVLKVAQFDVSRTPIHAVDGANRATHVIHAASIASPSFYRQHPLETLDANVWGLRQLLDAYAGSDRLRGLLFFSSSEIYGDPPADQIPTREEYRGHVACIGPRACYDEAKRFGETLCYVFARERGVPITIARPFNNFGPGMRLGDRRLPADLASCVLEGRDIVIHSDGSPTRTFCYVSDAVAGYLLCLLHGRFDAFNIGIERPEISVRDVAALYRETGRALLGYSGDVRFEPSRDQEYLADNPNRRSPDISKARRELAYEPTVLVNDGVRRYLAFLAHERT